MEKVFQFIIQKAMKDINPKKIFLFGSRARDDFHAHSDIDLAFEFDEFSFLNHWAKFCIDIEETAPTLLKMDLVNLNEANKMLKDNIYKDGKVLYQR